jgi:hypothetical protein
MCVNSFYKEALNITIHNQCPDLELTSPVYYNHGTPCHVFPSQQTEIGTKMEASFGIAKHDDIRGALLYKLQRKHTARIDNQFNSNVVGPFSFFNSSIASIGDTAKNLYLLVAWYVNKFQNRLRVGLIEFTSDFTCDEYKLWALSNEYRYQLPKDYDSDIITWLLNENSAVKTKLRLTYGSDYKLDIIISEGIGKYKMIRPMKIDPKK